LNNLDLQFVIFSVLHQILWREANAALAAKEGGDAFEDVGHLAFEPRKPFEPKTPHEEEVHACPSLTSPRQQQLLLQRRLSFGRA
jgi:hypothetical protein